MAAYHTGGQTCHACAVSAGRPPSPAPSSTRTSPLSNTATAKDKWYSYRVSKRVRDDSELPFEGRWRNEAANKART